MDFEEVQEMIGNLDDKHLIEGFEKARDDCESASINDPNSDWHEACFAAVMVFSQEILKRQLFASTVH